MRIAMFTDLPFLYQDKMYLSEIETRLKDHGFDISVFIIKGPKPLSKFRFKDRIFQNAKM